MDALFLHVQCRDVVKRITLKIIYNMLMYRDHKYVSSSVIILFDNVNASKKDESPIAVCNDCD